MEELAPPPPPCAACGKSQPDVRKLIAVGGPTLCDGCIQAYGTALKQALDEDARARAGSSTLIAAEEMALDLIDALETSRAEQAERELNEEIEERAAKLRLVEPEAALEAPRAEPLDEFESEASWTKPGEGGGEGGEAPPRPVARHCPWCTGNLEPIPNEGEPAGRYGCVSCGRRFDIHEAPASA